MLVINRKFVQCDWKGFTIKMSQKVVLEEGGSISVHTRIKDTCREARNRLGLTNQDISNMISGRFGIEDFSVNTVNNFFSERSKATTIYTTGYICAVLGISIDAVFGIEQGFSTEEEAELVRQLADLKADLRFKDQNIEHLEKDMLEKEARIQQANSEIEFLRRKSEADGKKVQPWVFAIVLALLVAALVFIIVYLVKIDAVNPNYGLIKSAVKIVNTKGLLLHK